jgi:putative transposase
MAAVQQGADTVGISDACRVLGVSRATLYRHMPVKAPPSPPEPPAPRPSPKRTLSEAQQHAVLGALHAPEFVDKAPRQVYATLLDRGHYLCSISTMYRLLAAHGEVKERRRQARHPKHVKPELVATGPNQVWSWDITKLRGPCKGVWYYLYVILDIYSRYVVGWMVAEGESAALAERLIEETCKKQGIEPGQLTIHADRGSSMKSKPVALLMVDLGVAKSHSRPRVSDDNPFSEAQFKTLKYHPAFPACFGSLADARQFCRTFFGWYNAEHRHSGLALLTPQMVHEGRAQQILQARQQVLLDAFRAHPERFVRKPPAPLQLPAAVWINRPGDRILEEVTQ